MTILGIGHLGIWALDHIPWTIGHDFFAETGFHSRIYDFLTAHIIV